MSPLSRRAFLRRGGAALALPWMLEDFVPATAGAAPTAVATSAWSDEDYWAFADRVQALLEPFWSPQHRK